MSKSLFQLIKKLSPNEKGYFKKSSRIHSSDGNNIYVQLFDILDKQTHYDKKEVAAFFGDKKIISQLPVISNYLYHLILDRLEEFNSEKTIESKLKKWVSRAEQLYIKGLYEQARVYIDKAREKAEKGENFLLLLQIHAFEDKLALREKDLENLKKIADTLNVAQTRVIEKFKNYMEYRQLVSRMFYLSKSSGRHLKSEKDQMELDRIMKHPLLADKKCALSVPAFSNFLLLHSYYHDIKKDRDLFRAMKLNMERLQLLESNTDLVAQWPASYFSALHNVLLNAGEMFDLDLFNALLEKVKNANRILKIKPPPEVEHFRNFMYLKYSIYQSFISGDFQQGINFIRGKEKQYYELHKELSEEEGLVYCHNLCSLFFGVGDFKKALYWTNQFLHSGQEMLRMDLWILVNWTNIIIHTELENFELAGSLMQSFIRFIHKYPGEFTFEKHFAKVLSGYIDQALNKAEERANQLKQLKAVLSKYTKAGMVNNVDLVFLLPWIKSKMEKRPFLEMYQKSLREFAAG